MFHPKNDSQSHPKPPKTRPRDRPLVEIPCDPVGPGRFIQAMLTQPHTPLGIRLLDDFLED